jgi:hypothetical protein
MDRTDRIQDLLSSFETISAELAAALNDPASTDPDIAWLRVEVLAIEADVADLSVEPDCMVRTASD